jgi:hypothetical protein
MAREEHPSAPGALSPDQFIRYCRIVVESVTEVDRLSVPPDQRWDLVRERPDLRCWDVEVWAHAPGQEERRTTRRHWSTSTPTAEDVVRPTLRNLRIVSSAVDLRQFWTDLFEVGVPPFDESTAEWFRHAAAFSTFWLRQLVGDEAVSLAAGNSAALGSVGGSSQTDSPEVGDDAPMQ